MSVFGSPRGAGRAAGPRWTALTGMAILAIVASACSSAATQAPATQAPVASAAASQAAVSQAPASQAAGSLTIGSNLSDDVPKKAFQSIVDAFTKATGITVKVNTVDHSTFQNQLSSYLQGTPEDVITWFSGHRMRFFANQGLFTPIDDVWSQVGSNYSDAMKTASTNDDSHQYLIPFDTYAWTVYYRTSIWSAKGYQAPATLDDMITLAKKMQTDGLVPIGLGDKDGWPAMGHFDIIDLRVNGYQFHIDLMNGKAKWTDPKVKAVFESWKKLLPFYQTGAAGRIWQDACAGLVKKTTGMMLQPQCGETFAAAGASDFADLTFAPWPSYGTQYDAEKALDAPIDGFMITAKSPTLKADMANAKAFLAFVAKGSTQLIYAKANPSLIGTAKDVDTSGYTPLQQAQAKVIGDAQKLTQFLDRDARSDLAGPNGMQAFLVNFLQNPNQDLDAYLKKIQDFVDSLGPES
jgi:multiple sugar transport system substrate-binding protein